MTEQGKDYSKLYNSLKPDELKLIYVFFGGELELPFSRSSLNYFAEGIDLAPNLSSLVASEVLKEVEMKSGEKGYQLADYAFYNWVQENIS